MAVRNPEELSPSVWPPPRSLATTCGISVDVFSWPYLDVSVQAVPLLRLFDSTQDNRVLLCWVPPFGYPRINGYLLLPVAFRSLSRPSSAPDAKAFPLRSFQLDLLVASSVSLAATCTRQLVHSAAPHFPCEPARAGLRKEEKRVLTVLRRESFRDFGSLFELCRQSLWKIFFVEIVTLTFYGVSTIKTF